MGHEDVSRVTQLIKQVSATVPVLMVEHNMSVVSSNRRYHFGTAAGKSNRAGP